MEQTELQKNDAQYLKMTTAPVGPLILSLAVPSMVTTLITSIYNLADTFFVGQIGTSATAAVGVVFSISMVLLALGWWLPCLISSMILYPGLDRVFGLEKTLRERRDAEINARLAADAPVFDTKDERA